MREWRLFMRAAASGVLAVMAALAGCAEDAPARASATPRIVSLSPAVTESVIEIGLGAMLVGRTPWCTSVDPAIPVAGDLRDVDAERLLSLRPTVVLVQPARTGMDPQLRALADRAGWSLRGWTIDGVDDIITLLAELPEAVLEDGPARRRAVDASERAIAAIRAVLAPDAAVAAAGRTMLLFSIDPPMAFGRGSYLDDVLRRCGGRNAVDIDGFPELSLEDLVRAAPDTVVFVGSRARAAKARETLMALGVTAHSSSFIVLDDPAALIPGPSVARVAASLREIAAEATRSEHVDEDPHR